MDANQNRSGFKGMLGSVSLFLLLALLLITVFTALNGFVLALKEYSILYGRHGSPWVGLRNFSEALAEWVRGGLLSHSLVLKAAELAAAVGAGGALALLIALIPGRGVRLGVSAALLIPALAPATLFAGLFAGFQNSPLAFLLCTLIPSAAFAAFVGGALSSIRGDGATGAVVGVLLAALLLAMRLFTPDVPTLLLLQSPMNYAWTDIPATHAYRSGMINGAISSGAASETMLGAIQLAVALAAAGLFGRLAPDKGLQRDNNRGALPACALTGAALVVAVMLLSGFEGSLPLNQAGIVYPLLAGLAGGAVTFALSGAPARKWLAVTAAVVLSLSGNRVTMYLQMREWGLVNTIWPPVLLTALEPRVFSVLALMALIANDFNRGWVCLAGALATAAYAWGDYYLPMLYIMRLDGLNAGYMARQVVISGSHALSGMLYCALPAALLAGLSAAALVCRSRG